MPRYYTIKFAKRSRKKPLKNPYCQLGTNKRIKQWPEGRYNIFRKKATGICGNKRPNAGNAAMGDG